jgi:hypothetical protein
MAENIRVAHNKRVVYNTYLEIRKVTNMLSTNSWNKESARYYITTITIGDTELEVYGEVIGPEDNIGYTGDVELHDVRITCPDGTSTSIWEMVNCYPEMMADIESKVCEVSL